MGGKLLFIRCVFRALYCEETELNLSFKVRHLYGAGGQGVIWIHFFTERIYDPDLHQK